MGTTPRAAITMKTVPGCMPWFRVIGKIKGNVTPATRLDRLSADAITEYKAPEVKNVKLTFQGIELGVEGTWEGGGIRRSLPLLRK